MLEPAVRRPFAVPRVLLLDFDTERFDQPAILHARRAGRFAAPAVEAEIQMSADLVGQFQPAVGDRPHQIDSPARAVVFVAGLQIRRARGGAQTAVDAVQEPFVVDRLPQVVGVARRLIGGWGCHVG